MRRFIEGQVRSQLTLMPESLEDYIGADNPVRGIDAFVNTLDLAEMGFDASATTLKEQSVTSATAMTRCKFRLPVNTGANIVPAP